MKRSRSITLAFMAGAALTLTACSEESDTQDLGQLYADKTACMQDRSEAECETEYQTALREHAATAPKFKTQAECEAQFGPAGCATTAATDNSGTSMFMPLMMGYMMGSMMSRPTPAYYGPGSYRETNRDNRPLYSGSVTGAAGAAAAARPLGYASGSGARTSVFAPSARTGGAPSAAARSSSVSAASTSTRGGVGTTAASRGTSAVS